MTNEDKNLLLKDLCARLPYGVVLDTGTKLRSVNILTKIVSGVGTDKKIENRKYYLRPMSSMTKEEMSEYRLCISMTKVRKGDALTLSSVVLVDWLYAHHLDFRGLIEKGLALEAPEGMYKNE